MQLHLSAHVQYCTCVLIQVMATGQVLILHCVSITCISVCFCLELVITVAVTGGRDTVH